MGIGATDKEDKLARFSARGPGPIEDSDPEYYQTSSQLRFEAPTPKVVYGRTKPDFSAPGVKVLSASAMNLSGYEEMSGTSM
jgi:subtilisin family serine protease